MSCWREVVSWLFINRVSTSSRIRDGTDADVRAHSAAWIRSVRDIEPLKAWKLSSRPAEVYFFLQQLVPSVIALSPRIARTINKHRSFRQIGHVIALTGTAKIALDTKMKNEILNRVEKIPESSIYSPPSLVCRLSPSAQGRFHAYQNVMNGT